MVVSLQRNQARDAFRDTPLTWRPVRMPDQSFSATVVCKNGHHGLIDEHTIAADGTVTPSVVCTGPDGKGEETCGWHENVRLEGWSP